VYEQEEEEFGTEWSPSTKIVEFAEKYEREFSMMIGPLGSGCLMFKTLKCSSWTVGFSAYDRDEVSVLSISETDSTTQWVLVSTHSCSERG
jgi:hypothetical protein